MRDQRNIDCATLVYGPQPPLAQDVLIGCALWKTGAGGGADGTFQVEHALFGKVTVYPTDVWPKGTAVSVALPSRAGDKYSVPVPGVWPGARLKCDTVIMLTVDSSGMGRAPVGLIGFPYVLWRVLGEPPVDTSMVWWEPQDYANDVVARLHLLQAARHRLSTEQWRRVVADIGDDPGVFLDVSMLDRLLRARDT